MDLAHRESARHRVGNPAAVARPAEVVHLASLALGNHSDFLRSHLNHVDAVHLVVPQDAFAIGRPKETIFIGVGVLGQLDGFFFAVLSLDVDLVLTRAVADVGDVFAVGRPSHIAVVGIVALGQIPRDARLDWHCPHIAPGTKSHTFSIGRNRARVDELAGIHILVANGFVVIGHLNGDGIDFSVDEVIAEQLAAVFVNDVLVAE